jgi:glyoxylase-like metal-dependent hydrolase (beta-lactamase superfamily II)
MKVIKLNTNPKIYSGNSYLLLGAWNTIDDINALIDSGSDNYIVEEIEKLYTGVGKNPVDKVVLTHNHFDHLGGALAVKNEYKAKVYAKIYSGDVVDYLVNDGDAIKLAEREFLVIHSPGHSTDSICLYCEEEQVLFSGDTTLQIRNSNDSYTEDYLETMQKLAMLKIKVIYPGHGDPITYDPEGMLRITCKNVSESKIILS